MSSNERATNWSVTLNLKSVKKETAEEFIQQARQSGWEVNGQLEQGEEGTEHYQLHVKTPQVRFSAVKKMFPTAHIEVARNVKALAKYVTKVETRVASLPEHDEKYITTSKLWDMIYQEFNNADGWDHMNEDEVELYDPRDHGRLSRDPLAFFDLCMSRFIRRGYFVDMIVTNPAVRSFWKKFWKDILYRAREVDRQTDRQSEKLSHEGGIKDADDGGEDTETEDESNEAEQEVSDGDEEGEGDSDEGYTESTGDESGASDSGSED